MFRPPLARGGGGGGGASDFIKTSKRRRMVGCKILILKGELAQKVWVGEFLEEDLVFFMNFPTFFTKKTQVVPSV